MNVRRAIPAQTSVVILSVGVALMLLGCGLMGDEGKTSQNDGVTTV